MTPTTNLSLFSAVHVTLLGGFAIAAAGLAAGIINAIVGSGSLIIFPTLVAIGYSPLVANVSNNVGLVFGNISAVHGYRRELVGQKGRLVALIPWAAAGGVTGAGLLLAKPSSFHAVVPWLIILAVVMVIIQPKVARTLAARRPRNADGAMAVRIGAFLSGIYGGYFGAAQGVILIALLAMNIDDHLQRLNGLKNVLVAVVNGVAGVLFILFAPVNYEIALIIAVSSTVGGQFGAKIGRKLPAPVLRAIIVVGGLGVSIKLLAG